MAGQRPADFGLEGRLSDEIQKAFSDALIHWNAFNARIARGKESATTITRETWVLPLLEEFGFALAFQRAAAAAGGSTFMLSHRLGADPTAPPVHIVSCEQRLDVKGDAPRSPHALVQDYLNRSDALCGIVTNGKTLRLLRNTVRFSRPSFIELDLEAIFKSNLYSEFVLLYRLVHATRLPRGAGDAHECWLEKYYQQGIEQGGRVRERLRDGVQEALQVLGTGLLAHPDSGGLRHKLESGRLTKLDYYRQLLRLIYRLLFLMVAEERRLLFVRDSEFADRQDVYDRWYSVERLRKRADNRFFADAHGDLWEGLKQTFRLFEDTAQASQLGLTALDGELFGRFASADLIDTRDEAGPKLRNDRLLSAIWHLSTFEDAEGRRRESGVRRRVNFGGLDVEELGSVYESLLDYRPEASIDGERSTFELVAGTERKSTGSYYTPPELVRELIKSALEPVIENRLAKAATREDKERALLSLKLGDPASGSGHFMLAAARRLGRELARVRSGVAEPNPADYRRAVRDVIRRCIYAVDKNPLAVDLCKVALWIEGHEPGLPLSFLDHHVKCGDSLIGVFDLDVLRAGVPDGAYKPVTGDDKAVASEIKKRNRADAKGLFRHNVQDSIDRIAGAFADIADLLETTPEEVRAKEAAYAGLRRGDDWARAKWACDLWAAAFFAPLTQDGAAAVATTRHVWEAADGHLPQGRVAGLTTELALAQPFLHWPLEFPEVFTAGGFDVMLGNPPWERIKLQEKEFFATRDRDIARAPNKSERDRLIKALYAADAPAEKCALGVEWLNARHTADCESKFVCESGRYPLTAFGDINTYAIFAETFLRALAPTGRSGFIVPTGIATDDTTKTFFEHVSTKGRLISLDDFQTGGGFFNHIGHARFKFCLLVLSAESDPHRSASFLFFSRNIEDFSQPERHFNLSAEEIAGLNPNTRTTAIFRTQVDAELTKRIYRRVPVLIDESKGDADNRWRISFMTMFHMANDSHLFRTKKELRDNGAARDGSDWIGPDGKRFVPLYEAKMVHQFDHRWGTFASFAERPSGSVSIPRPSPDELLDHSYSPEPWYWVSEREVLLRLARLPSGLLRAIREQNASGIVLGLAHLLFAQRLGRLFGDSASEAMKELYPAWQAFIAEEPFAWEIAPTQLGLCGDNPAQLKSTGPDCLPAEPWIRTGPREATAWYAADERLVAAYLEAMRPYHAIAEKAPPLHDEDEALAFAEECLKLASTRWLMGWRDITNATNERTVIAAALPRWATNHKVPLILATVSSRELLPLLANLNCLVLDFLARKKLGGTSLIYSVVKQFPIIPCSNYRERETKFVSPRVLELTYTAEDMRPFAQDLGYDGSPFEWDPNRRAVLRAELGAYYAYLYGLTRRELQYILDPKAVMGEDYPSESFRVLKENEIKEFGEYRTQRLVLEVWDRFAADGTFDPARLREPQYIDRMADELTATRAKLKQVEYDSMMLLALASKTPEPTLFVEGATDAKIIEAAWAVFFPSEPMPVKVVAAGGTKEMGSLAGKGKRCASFWASGSCWCSRTTMPPAACSPTTATSARAAHGASCPMASTGACSSQPHPLQPR